MFVFDELNLICGEIKKNIYHRADRLRFLTFDFFMVLHGPFMATYRFGLIWSFLAVIDPNSFGLVFGILSFCRTVKYIAVRKLTSPKFNETLLVGYHSTDRFKLKL